MSDPYRASWGTPDPKPSKRKKASPKQWRRLREKRALRCTICGALPTSLHHIVPRSLGGDDVDENLVALCGDGTTGCHGLVEARDPHAVARLRAGLTPEQLKYVLEKKGPSFLARHLPG